MMSLLLDTFKSTVKFIEQSVADLSEQEMVRQSGGITNHATWTIGHVVAGCQGVANELGCQGWLPDQWESTFGYGSVPVSDLSHYPSKSEILRALIDAGDRLDRILMNVSEATLKQTHPDGPLPTTAHLLFQVVVAHTAYHAGQLAMWRRAIGKGPAAVFV